MPSPVDITGVRSGRLVAVKPTTTRVSGKIMWECLCDCGVTVLANVQHIGQGRRVSCGCSKKKGNQLHKKTSRHGQCVNGVSSRTYMVWSAMRNRCLNKSHKAYKHYGGRGITVCPEWGTFEGFYKDMGDAPNGLSLDREDNDKGYSKGNCRWATPTVQHNNTRANVFWEFNGVSQTISQWATDLGMPRSTLRCRVAKEGWSIEKALTTPIQTKQEIAKKTNDKRWGK